MAKPMPYKAAFSQLEELAEVDDPNDPASAAVAGFMPAIGRVYNLKTRSQAQANAIEAGIIVCLDKAKSGRLPRKLPADAPQDPFSGKPFDLEMSNHIGILGGGATKSAGGMEQLEHLLKSCVGQGVEFEVGASAIEFTFADGERSAAASAITMLTG